MLLKSFVIPFIISSCKFENKSSTNKAEQNSRHVISSIGWIKIYWPLLATLGHFRLGKVDWKILEDIGRWPTTTKLAPSLKKIVNNCCCCCCCEFCFVLFCFSSTASNYFNDGCDPWWPQERLARNQHNTSLKSP